MKTKRRWFRLLGRPMTPMVILWAAMRALGVDIQLGSIWAWVVFIPMVVVLVMEFRLSMDIAAVAFARDLLFAILNLVITTAVITWIATSPVEFRLIDALVAGCVIVDAWVSPTNSFHMALRNLSGQIQQGPIEGTEGT